MGTASSKNKVAAGTPQPAPAAPPPTAAPAEDDIVITTRAVRGESKVAPAPHDGAKHVQSSRSFGTAASTPGRLKRRRMVSIQNDEGARSSPPPHCLHAPRAELVAVGMTTSCHWH